MTSAAKRELGLQWWLIRQLGKQCSVFSETHKQVRCTQWEASSQRRIKKRSHSLGRGSPVSCPILLTSVDIFLVPFQGLLAFQPLPTAVGFAHKPGIPSASLLVLLKTIRQVARGAEVITIYLQTLNITAGFCNPCLLGHASYRSLGIILCINYVGKKEVLKFFSFLCIMLTNSKYEIMHSKMICTFIKAIL